MSKQDLTDIQIVIDKLFARLDAAASEWRDHPVQSCPARPAHEKEENRRGAMQRELVGAVGQIADQKSGGSLWVFVLILLVIGGLYVAYRLISD